MSRLLSSVLLCLSCFFVSQLAAQGSSSTVQVIYVVQGTSILTYDIDPQTLMPTQVGTLAVNNAATFYFLVPSPNDHFLYYIADDAQAKRHLWVFATDANGAPLSHPTEQVEMDHLFWLTIDPVENYAYLVLDFPGGAFNNDFELRRYLINQTNGTLSQPIVESRYKLPNGAEGTEECWLYTDGFNPTATKMYDDVPCSYHGGGSDTYYERTLDPKTGALGPDQQVFSSNNSSGGGDYVQFVGSHLFDFNIPNTYQQGINTENIFPIAPNTSKPTLQCTAQMLEACGYSSSSLVHPSGNYVFMGISPNSTQIDRVEWSAKKIVDTGNYIPYPLPLAQFSPDGTLFYAQNTISSGYILQIYGFDTSTSAVTPGGSIGVSPYAPFFAAQRR